MPPLHTVPQFYFPKENKCTHDQTPLFMKKIKTVFEQHPYLTELEFEPVTALCALPRFMNLALFRAIDMQNQKNDQVTFEQFERSWPILIQEHRKKSSVDDIHSLMYFILKKPEFDYMTPEDFLPVLEDIVLNHPALQFLENNITFQERYIETVICRIYYDAHCPSGKLSLACFKKSGIATLIETLTSSIDLYTTHNLFSYKQFYVLYCKLWSLDTDHDLSITETDLCNYNMGTLTRLAVERIMEVGHVEAFADTMVIADDDAAVTAAAAAARTASTDHSMIPVADPLTSLTYFDFIWFLLSEVDKSTPMAIRYWFRCLDIDDDGILSSYELSQFWHDQNIKQQFFGSVQQEERIQFDDIMRQMNDLIRPETPGQFSLKDLKKNGFLAERFFDTFINFDRFQVHESRQEGSIREQQAFQSKLLLEEGIYDAQEPVVLTDDLGFPVLSNWNDFAEVEYHRIILDENYANSYEQEEEEDEDFHQTESDDDEGLIIAKLHPVTTDDAIESLNQPNINTPIEQDQQDQDQDDDSSVSSSSSSSSSSTVSDTESISNKAELNNNSPETETDSNDEEEEEYDDFEDSCAPNSPCIFTPKTLVGDDDSKLSPTTNDLNNTTTSYFDLKTDHHRHHHQQPLIL